MRTDRVPWGTDGVVSLPVPLDTTNTEMVDMEGFCFTPKGLRVNTTHADREDLISESYGPQGVHHA